MPIIRPDRKFSGSEIGNQGSASILKPDIKAISFKNAKVSNPLEVFILGAYKQDSEGNGVWYKVVKVRDNFGVDTKEKFAVQSNCPVDWFASKVKAYAPNLAKVEEVVKDGRKMKVYPSFGRTTFRVLFNAAYKAQLGEGAHVLDVPKYQCGEKVDQWCQNPDKPMINDYQAALPIEIIFDLERQGNPWDLSINAYKQYQLPEQLADTDYLYNLDDVINYPDKEVLIEKLRRNVPSDLFNRCMSDYSDGTIRVAVGAIPAEVADDIPMAFAAPKPVQVAQPVQAAKPAPVSTGVAPTMPKRNTAPKPAPAPVAEVAAEVVDGGEDGEDMPRPPASTSGVNVQKAKAFLQR